MTSLTLGTRDRLDPALVQLIEAGTAFAATLGPVLVELAEGRAVLTLDAAPTLHNHLGGPHAATLFGLAETAAAAVIPTLFADLLQGGCVPLIKSAEVDYVAIATGVVTASATFTGDADGVRASVAERGVAVFPVEVVLAAADGRTTATVTARMALKQL